ncbi:MAG: hypothetical protein K2P59_13800 [Acetatifactor sp.]|jgi:hypothetical protein|nr:hypothetical protein [Acetatifactor sp.]
MAADKKTTAKVEAPKTAAKKAADTKTAEPVQAETEKKETVKSETAAAKKEAGKKTTETKKTVEKKTAEVKKTVGRGRKPAAKKAELKSELHLQFGGNSYTQDELVKIAKDVWKYDLKQKVGDLETVELYIKPEEHAVYYVMNKEFTGSFYI